MGKLAYEKSATLNMRKAVRELNQEIRRIQPALERLGIPRSYGMDSDGVNLTGFEVLDLEIAKAFSNAVKDAKKRMRKWAKDLEKDMKEKTPVHTGNIQESIVIKDEIDDDDTIMKISVGVDEDKLIGPKTLPVVKRYRKGNQYEYEQGGQLVSDIPGFDYIGEAEQRTRKLSMFASKIWEELDNKNARKDL